MHVAIYLWEDGNACPGGVGHGRASTSWSRVDAYVVGARKQMKPSVFLARCVPGMVVACMSLWWVLPFFLRDVREFDVGTDLPSFMSYFIAFGGVFLLIPTVWVVEWRWGLWAKRRFGGRALYAALLYAILVCGVLLVHIHLDACGLIEYFGGDAGGSFGLLYVPSAVFYLVLAGAGFAVSPLMRRCRGLSRMRQDPEREER